jgi:hypothetical protein
MADPAQDVATQLANIEKRTGKTLQQLADIVRKSGLAKHGEIRDMLKRELGMGHGDANTLTHHVLGSAGPSIGEAGEESLDAIVAGYYDGPKAALRPIHDALMAGVAKLGPFETAPKKTYLSLRRRKQFAMIGPATKTQVEVGLNVTGLTASDRLVALPAGGMCNYRVRIASLAEVDAALLGWISKAYDAAA